MTPQNDKAQEKALEALGRREFALPGKEGDKLKKKSAGSLSKR